VSYEQHLLLRFIPLPDNVMTEVLPLVNCSSVISPHR
jgi:hypothetical protein